MGYRKLPKKKTYLEISITANERQRELLIPIMLELGCQGFWEPTPAGQETDAQLLCYIDKSLWNEGKSARLKEELKKILQTVLVDASIRFREIVEKNWNEQWERTIQPIEVGRRLVIKPSWSSYENREGRIVIQIDPKMSFGTGYHETTRLTLQLVEQYLQRNDGVLDVGTGTGILAIAALKLGASFAIAIDNDEWAITNARENVQINGLSDKIEITETPLNEIRSTFDVITANLSFHTIAELMKEFRKKLHGDGLLLLSGLLASDKKEILTCLEDTGFAVIETLAENEWIALAARKVI